MSHNRPQLMVARCAAYICDLLLAAPVVSLFLFLKKVLLHPSMRCLLFLYSPKIISRSPKAKPGLNRRSRWVQMRHNTSPLKHGTSTTTSKTDWHLWDFQDVILDRHWLKQRHQPDNAPLNMPLSTRPHANTHLTLFSSMSLWSSW